MRAPGHLAPEPASCEDEPLDVGRNRPPLAATWRLFLANPLSHLNFIFENSRAGLVRHLWFGSLVSRACSPVCDRCRIDHDPVLGEHVPLLLQERHIAVPSLEPPARKNKEFPERQRSLRAQPLPSGAVRQTRCLDCPPEWDDAVVSWRRGSCREAVRDLLRTAAVRRRNAPRSRVGLQVYSQYTSNGPSVMKRNVQRVR